MRPSGFPATIADLYDPNAMPENLRRAHEENDETLERIYIGRRFAEVTIAKLIEGDAGSARTGNGRSTLDLTEHASRRRLSRTVESRHSFERTPRSQTFGERQRIRLQRPRQVRPSDDRVQIVRNPNAELIDRAPTPHPKAARV